MQVNLDILIFLASFIFIALAAKQIGQYFARYKLPLITGFIVAGIIAGPFVLNLISEKTTQNLRFVYEISLAFIAFAAGSELYIKELRDRLKSIKWITIGLVIFTFGFGSLATFLLADFIPFMRDMSEPARIAVSMLSGATLVACSPSSAIAIVNELRARGPFTQTVLGVTIIMDVVVIVLFAINSSIADAFLADVSLDLTFILMLIVEFVLSIGIAFVLGYIIKFILSRHTGSTIKTSLVLLSGYGVFFLSSQIRHFTHEQWHLVVLLEPLLICMAASFWVANYSKYRIELLKILNDIGPAIYIAFFTLIGASLALDIVAETWPIALALFGARFISRFFGSLCGGAIAGDPMRHNRVSWMSYLTQAGIALALAEQVAVEFPDWGKAFAAMIIAVIVLNQIAGPPLFKWALFLVGEAHPRAEAPDLDEVRSAIIFGFEAESMALARQLKANNWRVKVVTKGNNDGKQVEESDIKICSVSDFSYESLREIGLKKAKTVVAMLSDEENYEICKMAYEKFGNENLVVSLKDRANFDRFKKLDALIVEPSTAMISLLDHFVRSPASASLFAGREANWNIMDVELRNPSLNGVFLRDLSLPLDILILSIRRGKQMLISHGHTRLRVGDWITVVGSLKSLDELSLRFED
jgi:Kef-type K+ transport system membrane component KefB/Trk K+ transport system NAD-binding subunit